MLCRCLYMTSSANEAGFEILAGKPCTILAFWRWASSSSLIRDLLMGVTSNPYTILGTAIDQYNLESTAGVTGTCWLPKPLAAWSTALLAPIRSHTISYIFVSLLHKRTPICLQDVLTEISVSSIIMGLLGWWSLPNIIASHLSRLNWNLHFLP